MNKLRGLILMCVVPAFTLGGCVIHDWSDDCEDDSYEDDYYDGYDDYDDYAEPTCQTNADCGGGWVCDVYSSECVPEPESCTENVECGPGCYCEENQCIPSPVCIDDLDCPESFTCDGFYNTCVPKELTCADLTDEATCAADPACEPVYAGIDCSCGPDCTCIGGEPGCVCESFQFFACEDGI